MFDLADSSLQTSTTSLAFGSPEYAAFYDCVTHSGQNNTANHRTERLATTSGDVFMQGVYLQSWKHTHTCTHTHPHTHGFSFTFMTCKTNAVYEFISFPVIYHNHYTWSKSDDMHLNSSCSAYQSVLALYNNSTKITSSCRCNQIADLSFQLRGMPEKHLWTFNPRTFTAPTSGLAPCPPPLLPLRWSDGWCPHKWHGLLQQVFFCAGLRDHHTWPAAASTLESVHTQTHVYSLRSQDARSFTCL